MLLTMMMGKLHRAAVTHTEMHYNGSLGVDFALIEQAGMLLGQQIDVLNIDNGERFTTYLIEEPAGSRRIGVYGAAAHLVDPGDRIIVIAYAQMDHKEAKTFRPSVLILNEANEIESHA